MTAEEKIKRGYMITVSRFSDAGGIYTVSYVPRGPQQMKTSGRAKKVPEYKATVNVQQNDLQVRWDFLPKDTEATPAEFGADAHHRSHLLHNWLTKVLSLIATVEEYGKSLGWSTRLIDKPMEDSEIGEYTAPALLLQEETTKILLEPIARRAPGTEGVADLYLMPGYDDIASFYFYSNRWNLHYLSPKDKMVAEVREGEAMRLTEANFRKVLNEMRAHAK